MKCSKCGAELSDDTKFCSYCGHKIGAITPPPVVAETDIPPVSDEEKVNDATKSFADKVKEKASGKWSGLSTYSKAATVSIAVFALLFLVALLSGKAVAVLSRSMHKFGLQTLA